MQGGDKLCFCSSSYQNTMNRICQKCNIPGFEVGNPLADCNKISMNKVKHLVTTNQNPLLDSINQYNVYNAFFDVNFGGCKFGIFSSGCPTELLHSLESGIIENCLDILIFELMTNVPRTQLDKLAQKLCLIPRQKYLSLGTENFMPQLLFEDDITTLTNITARCHIGIIFTIVVLSFTDEGKDLFESVLQERATSNMRYIFHMLLCYWS